MFFNSTRLLGFLCFFLALLMESKCCVVINNETLARRCLDIQEGMIVRPLNLTSQINGNFICNETKPYYAFFCTLYSTDLIWYFNGKRINSFQNKDMIGRSFQTMYPDPPENPIYNITTILTHRDNQSIETYNASFCISSLTVQPSDTNDISVIPFNVSCHTHCLDSDHTEICENKQYNIAAKPEKPKNLTITIKMVAADSNAPSAVAAIDWNSAEDSDTTVVSYNLTLKSKSNVNDTTITYVSLHNSSYTEVVMEGNYTVSVSAVDTCGQESEAAILVFHVNTSALSSPCQSQMQAVSALSFFLTFAIVTGVTIIVLETLCLLQCSFCPKRWKQEFYSFKHSKDSQTQYEAISND